ncbi:DUF1643 domain-containing protein [Sphingobium sp. HDIP04]|uniref:DUF1643 domain-containing protein n=1 Tax=Sphingobium sp. HDIP04 TaxID=428994 RepID=UPI000387621B|nr:DUF1643 domain-containing protein [Sphingobium sp. HDIP04]EQA97246.1 hypothetical protein L286_23250 [Sphingobium sp. HDIP04]
MNAPLPHDLFGNETMQRDAIFAGHDRIELIRLWGPGPIACVIGCNPSNADAKRDDPTTLWWIDWFQLFGFGGFRAVNLYPFCTSSPAECRKRADWHLTDDWYVRDQIIMTNLPHVGKVAKEADQVFVCWGNIAWDDMWIEHVIQEIQQGEAPWPDLWCWGKTKSGAPKHPMARGKHRIPKDQKPILWRAGE